MKMKEPTFLLWLLIGLAIVFMILFICAHADAMSILYTDTINEMAQKIGGQHAL